MITSNELALILALVAMGSSLAATLLQPWATGRRDSDEARKRALEELYTETLTQAEVARRSWGIGDDAANAITAKLTLFGDPEVVLAWAKVVLAASLLADWWKRSATPRSCRRTSCTGWRLGSLLHAACRHAVGTEGDVTVPSASTQALSEHLTRLRHPSRAAHVRRLEERPAGAEDERPAEQQQGEPQRQRASADGDEQGAKATSGMSREDSCTICHVEDEDRTCRGAEAPPRT